MDHELEPVPGLPEHLPQGESILWQGKPRWQLLAARAMHLRMLALYFGGLAVWRAATLLGEGATAAGAAVGAMWIVALGLAAMGLLALIAWLAAWTTMYTITNRRVVLRVGVALPLTINLPYASIAAASLNAGADGCGDVALALVPEQRISYALLWPHARPWRFSRAEPMLRGVPDAAGVAQVLARALAASASLPVPAMPDAAAANPPPRSRAAAAA